MRLIYLFVLLFGVACSNTSIFRYNGAQHQSNRSNAIEVSVSHRATLVNCGGEITGTLEGVDPLIGAYEASRRGATHFVMVGNTIECWHADNECVGKSK